MKCTEDMFEQVPSMAPLGAKTKRFGSRAPLLIDDPLSSTVGLVAFDGPMYTLSMFYKHT